LPTTTLLPASNLEKKGVVGNDEEGSGEEINDGHETDDELLCQLGSSKVFVKSGGAGLSTDRSTARTDPLSVTPLVEGYTAIVPPERHLPTPSLLSPSRSKKIPWNKKIQVQAQT
jgi:hypothetical protein